MQGRASFWQTAWHFLKPEIEEIIFYLLSVIVFMAIAFYQAVIVHASTGSTEAAQGWSLIQDSFSFITNGDDSIAKLFTFGLWFLIGTVVYTLAWFVITFSSGAFHDVEVSNSYLHPSSFKKSNYWLSIFSRIILRLAAAISLILYVSFWSAAIAPAWLASFKEAFAVGLEAETAINIIIALVGIAFSLHLAAILLRITLLRSQYSYER